MGSRSKPTKNLSLYIRVKDRIIQQIQEKKWKANSMIPTESELMEEFDVSRTTIRQAISILVQEGILERRQGKGTIIKPQLFVGTLSKLKGFAEEAKENGMIPSSKLLSVTMSRDFPYEKSILQVPKGEEICLIERLRFVNQLPIAIERSFWPKEIGELLSSRDLNDSTFYEILEENHIFLKHASEKISAVNATLSEADLLGIRGGQAMLKMERLSFGNGDRPIELTTTKFSEKYKYHMELMR